jgi:hypothetical protein
MDPGAVASTAGARSSRSVKALKRPQSSREALQQESTGVGFVESGVGGLSETGEKLRNAPQLPFSRMLIQVLEDVVSVETLGLSLEIISNILLEIFESHDDSAYAARATSSDHHVGATEPFPGLQ